MPGSPGDGRARPEAGRVIQTPRHGFSAGALGGTRRLRAAGSRRVPGSARRPRPNDSRTCVRDTPIRRLATREARKSSFRTLSSRREDAACPRKSQRVPTGRTPWSHERPDDHLGPARNSPSIKSTTLIAIPTGRSGQPPRWCADAGELSAGKRADVLGDTRGAQGGPAPVQEAVAENNRNAVQLLAVGPPAAWVSETPSKWRTTHECVLRAPNAHTERPQMSTARRARSARRLRFET